MDDLDLIYNNEFMKKNFPCSIYNIDLSILPLKSFVEKFLKNIPTDKIIARYFLENRKSIDKLVIEKLLIYQPDYTDGIDTYSSVIGSILEEILPTCGLIRNTWEISDLIEPSILEEQLSNYHRGWVFPTLSKTLYKQFKKDLYILNYSERAGDFEFYIPTIFEDYKDLWSIENINCRINDSLARRDFLVLTILKVNERVD